jgi:hypothetical protein
VARSIHRVQIALSRGTFELPWSSREALLDELAHQDSMQDIRDAFQAVGTSRPVKLNQAQKMALTLVIEVWGGEVEGGLTGGLPEGIFELRNALLDDLHDDPPASFGAQT